jgi:exodeoxyribonuclease VII large subunit
VALQTSLQIAQNRLVRHTSTLKALDPTAVLKRGYALITDATGNVITRAESTSPGAQVQIRLSEGALSATVDSLHPEITTEADTPPSHSQTTP